MNKNIKLLSIALLSISVVGLNLNKTLEVVKKSRALESIQQYTLLEKGMYDSVDYGLYNNYLRNGGIIINTPDICMELVNECYNVNYGLLNETNKYGTRVYFNGKENKVIKFDLSYLSSSTFEVVDKEIIASQLYDEVYRSMHNKSFARDVSVVFNDNIIKILYKDNTNTKICSYNLETKIYDNYKTNSGSVVKGNYCVQSFVYVSPESDYCVSSYDSSIVINNNLNKIQYSYLNTNPSEQNVVSSSGNYVDNLNSSANSDYFGQQLGVNIEYELESLDDYSNSNLKLKMNSMTLKDNGWWIFQKTYQMSSSNAIELDINWDYYGLQ